MCTNHDVGGEAYLTFRRVRIVSIGVPGSNLAITTMNQDFGLLTDSDAAGDSLSFSLSGGALGSPGVTCAFDLPATGRVSGDMLIFAHELLLIPGGG